MIPVVPTSCTRRYFAPAPSYTVTFRLATFSTKTAQHHSRPSHPFPTRAIPHGLRLHEVTLPRSTCFSRVPLAAAMEQHGVFQVGFCKDGRRQSMCHQTRPLSRQLNTEATYLMQALFKSSSLRDTMARSTHPSPGAGFL